MNRTKRFFGVGLILTLAACVTINIYFPAAAAEKAADKVIDEVWGKEPAEGKPSPTPESSSRLVPESGIRILMGLADLVVAPAHAARADINVSTPAINKIKASMKARHAKLAAYYASGAVGLTSDGLVTVRNPGTVPLKQRRQVNTLVAGENRDRNTLYREIARANGHPEWETDIRNTFARRWVGKARKGWWYQGRDGSWLQK